MSVTRPVPESLCHYVEHFHYACTEPSEQDEWDNNSNVDSGPGSIVNGSRIERQCHENWIRSVQPASSTIHQWQ